MAVDTRDKRFSMLGFGQAWNSPNVMPNPDGAFTSGTDFEHLLYAYAGRSFDGNGDPRMMRWGGLPHVRQRPIFGRSW
ncbi:MAG: hypothetical protein Q7R41_19330 [Phycisphaerales bacterium]|nr:hypothetical protein [Phycisphaerales bacterium]